MYMLDKDTEKVYRISTGIWRKNAYYTLTSVWQCAPQHTPCLASSIRNIVERLLRRTGCHPGSYTSLAHSVPVTYIPRKPIPTHAFHTGTDSHPSTPTVCSQPSMPSKYSKVSQRRQTSFQLTPFILAQAPRPKHTKETKFVLYVITVPHLLCLCGWHLVDSASTNNKHRTAYCARNYTLTALLLLCLLSVWRSSQREDHHAIWTMCINDSL